MATIGRWLPYTGGHQYRFHCIEHFVILKNPGRKLEADCMHFNIVCLIFILVVVYEKFSTTKISCFTVGL